MADSEHRERGADLVERDQRVVWHPYAPPQADPLFAVDSAQGVTLQLTDGRSLVDGMSSWWSAIHGYRHPAIETAIKEQLERLPHVMFGGLTHEPAVRLCERLVEMTPSGLERVFLCDSGSIAVEVAIKLAFQYWLSRGQPQRNRLLTVAGGYHGDTFATMAVCDPTNGMHDFFRGVLPDHIFAERPACRFDETFESRHIADVEAKIAAHHDELAAVILEPVVQGAGGMWFYAPAYLERLRELCDEYDLLLIFDEIATGFGRTGEMFGAFHANVSPDILSLGKSLTGGTVTLAATLMTPRVSETIARGEPGALMHGPTYMGNPLACAAAHASLDLLESTPWRNNVKAIEQALREGLEPCRTLRGVTDVRTLGAIGVVELEAPVDMKVVQPAFVEEGVWVRPFGRLVYLMPPFVSEREQVETLTRAVCNVVSRFA
ncbi:MAG: adenosylmethionine--8-amino-7-oxononanoate transaminase [bacterium]|nr:adenosylmethionine--8-amino-7-oxononanoate transaminase [bacterium]MCP5043182.1 adenosylmethionine--8-amino-7-oxononanoate transaminase [bacterium]